MLDWLFGRKKQQEPPKEQKKKKKSKQQSQAEDKWMYQFLVQFLCSPIWKVSILDFVDNKCIVFDNQEQNKFQYTTIHNEFKQLVGTLFDGMMSEIGLSQDKLAQLLERGFQSKQRKVFNQLLLCDDFMRFKELMLKRNKALEQQALKQMHDSKLGIEKKPSKSQKQKQLVRQSQRIQNQRKKKVEQQQEQMMRKAIQMSMLQAKQQQAISKLQQKTEQYQKQKVNTKEQKKKEPQVVQEKIVYKQKTVEEQQIKQQPKKIPNKLESLKKPKTANSNLSDLPSIRQSNLNDLPPVKANIKKQQPQVQIEKQQKIQQKTKPKPIIQEQKKVQQQEIHQSVQSQEERKRRLLEQRQKIRKKKQQQRKRQMQQEQKQKQLSGHHNVHTIVLQQDGIHESKIGVKQQENKEKVSEDQIKRRKELMQKIKNRIVDDF